MAFQRLNIRAKKSFPGLYSFDSQGSESIELSSKSPSCLVLPKNEVEHCDLEDFGASLERCKDSPNKASPSKRKKMLGSLRSLRSLRNLHSPPSKTKQAKTPPHTQSPVRAQDPCVQSKSKSTSLGLDFEELLPDPPVFKLNMRHRSVSGSSLEVQHSSPMTVPGSARQMDSYTILPSSTGLPAGTIPDTPGPLQRAFDQDPANHAPWQNTSPTPLERTVPSAPVLTPLPGTNLSFDDVSPALVALPPSVTSLHTDHRDPGYFDIPVSEQPQLHHADVSNVQACLKLAANYNDTVNSGTESPRDSRAYNLVANNGLDEGLMHEYADSKPQDGPQYQIQTCALRRKQQIKDANNIASALNASHHHQTLPLRLKQQDADLKDRVRKDSAMSEDWDTSSEQPLTATSSEHVRKCCTRNQFRKTGDLTNIPVPPPSREKHQGTKDKSEPTANFPHVVCDSPNQPRQYEPPENIWGRHTGLYDGSGYGDDSTFPATPCGLDEGTDDTQPRSSSQSANASPTLPADGDRFGREIFTRSRNGGNIYSGHAQEYTSLTPGERTNSESLESIYHAYAYPFGERIPSGSSHSTEENAELSATKTTEPSSRV